MLARFINVIFAFDCFAFSVLTLGKAYPYESFSSAAYRAEQQGRLYGRARPWIDWIFRSIFKQKQHCQDAYYRAKFNLPEDMR
jgi:hypothetical protein